ncbi:MAG: ABC transporter substrate-binding protein [Deltaproteobacteria bacterium]|nr:ABC transporter substrate-binding protein [Deltaproteobacteria bacterium]
MFNRWITAFLLVGVLALLPLSVVLAAEVPTKIVRETIEKVRAEVLSTKGKVSDSELDKQLREIILPVFDFEEMSRRSIGSHWAKGTVEERREFVSLFSELLSNTYLNRIKDVDRSEVKYLDEKTNGKQALVKTMVRIDDNEVPIYYRMRRNQDVWRVYDVVIENISLVSNYRNEFSGVIRKDQFSGLLAKLREKSAE